MSSEAIAVRRLLGGGAGLSDRLFQPLVPGVGLRGVHDHESVNDARLGHFRGLWPRSIDWHTPQISRKYAVPSDLR